MSASCFSGDQISGIKQFIINPATSFPFQEAAPTVCCFGLKVIYPVFFVKGIPAAKVLFDSDNFR